MAGFRQTLLSLLPGWLRPAVKSFWKKLRAFKNNVFDRIGFPLWLAWQCLRHKKKAVILCRVGALGDVICTLPMCAEIRQRHPGNVLIFLTHHDYKKMVLLSRAPDEVYGAKSWTWPYALPEIYNFLGLVEKVYSALASTEISKNRPKVHLVDDLAGSCGITLINSHPQLNVSRELLERVRAKYGFAADVTRGRLIIGLNPGQVWPVRTAAKSSWTVCRSARPANSNSSITGARVGFIFQSFNLLPTLSAQENVESPMVLAEVPRNERRLRAATLLDSVGLSPRVSHKPNELSGGEKQRVAIARALANRPSLLLADEPTGNLDTKTGVTILDLLCGLVGKDGLTLIMVTHELEVAARADRIIHLRDGSIQRIETKPKTGAGP